MRLCGQVAVGVGESAAVSFAVRDEQLLLTDVDGSRKLVPGAYLLTFTNGAGQRLHAVYNLS